MELTGRGTRVRIYFGEHDHYEGKSLWSALLDFLRREGAAGATVLRGLAGYGAHSRIHAATLVDLSAIFPLFWNGLIAPSGWRSSSRALFPCSMGGW